MPAPRVPPLAGSLLQLPFACRGVSPEQGTAALLPIALISRRHPPPPPAAPPPRRCASFHARKSASCSRPRKMHHSPGRVAFVRKAAAV